MFDECAWRFDKMPEWRCYGGKATSKGFGSAQKSSSRRDTWNALEFKMKGCGLFSEETTLSIVDFITPIQALNHAKSNSENSKCSVYKI